MSEADLPRPRDPWERGRQDSIFAWLERARWFRPLALALPVAVIALVLAPELATRAYPTDPKLVGHPATENIKAPYDLTVADTETTVRLREEAVARVRRVFDFAARMGPDAAKKIDDAFAAVSAAKRAYLDVHPAYAFSERLSKGARARLTLEMARVADAARPELEKLVGSPLTAAEHAFLKSIDYDPAVGSALARAVALVLAEPVVDSFVTLEPDQGRGITVQRVPDDGTPNRAIDEIDTVSDVKAARKALDDLIAQALPNLTSPNRQLLADLAGRLIAPTLTLNRAATEVERDYAAASVKPVTLAIRKGEMIIRDGERLSPRHQLIFNAFAQSSARASTILVVLGGGVLVLILLLVGVVFGRARTLSQALQARDVVLLSVLFCLSLVMARLWLAFVAEVQDVFPRIPYVAFLYALPVAGAAMIVRLVLRLDVALTFAVVSSVVVGLLVEGARGFLIYTLVGSCLGVTLIRTMARRSQLLGAGVWVGVGQAAVAVGLQLLDAQTSVAAYLIPAVVAFGSGILAAFVALAMTSVVEAVFGYTTDLRLLELANLNHPALKELIVQAPGSYHHSIIVGALVEAAAETIGANSLLARVMAYYHDLGKGCNPAYFIENVRADDNPHDKLRPSMSAMIIKRHVTDGLDIAKRHGLGQPILDAIVEHHGTTLIHYFYQKAKEQADEPDGVADSEYRYPGRKPQTREAALVMIGDSIEAASRSLGDPTPARLQGLVHRIINLKFTDGQLEECDLTLRDLHIIAKAFMRVLTSIYHQRPEYPGLLTDLAGRREPDGEKPAHVGNRNDDDDDKPDNLRRLGLDGR